MYWEDKMQIFEEKKDWSESIEEDEDDDDDSDDDSEDEE